MIIFTFSLFEIPQSNFDGLSDKFIHFSAYLLLSLLIFRASLTLTKASLFIGLILLGVLIEALQYTSGLRNFEYMDIIANALGVLVGFLIFKVNKKALKITN
jgi:VanZ family protein